MLAAAAAAASVCLLLLLLFAAATQLLAPTSREYGAGAATDGVHLPRDTLRVDPRRQHDR